MILGINASRARSGGARAHLIGILSEADPAVHGFSEVNVWSYRELLEELPDRPWLVRHCPPETGRSMLRQLWWERSELPRVLKATGCDVLLNVDAGTVCRFRPAVTMSRDMLSYEPGEMQRYGIGKARLRLIALKAAQNASLRAATGAIFLSRYAGKVIQRSSGLSCRIAYIPHGVNECFRQVAPQDRWLPDKGRPIRCLYVSNIAPYKHQWHVVRAAKLLRDKGCNVRLTLTGGGSAGGASGSQARLDREIALCDPKREFVEVLGFVKQEELPGLFDEADVFVFASSCENMPNTLVEAMAYGLPIACSNRGPMPEVLNDAGVLFDPENPKSIANAIELIGADSHLRARITRRAVECARSYSWARCSRATFSFLSEIANESISAKHV